MAYTSDPSNFVTALARGLDVLEALGRPPQKQTSSEIAKATGLSRGTARRLLLTLEARNFVNSDGKLYWLTPKVLQFSNSYLLQSGIAEAARNVLPKLSDAVGENTSLAVLDLPDIVYLQRHEVSRIFSSGLEPGARLPAHCTSMGRVLLADLSAADLQRFLGHTELAPQTSKTVTAPDSLNTLISEVRTQGYCIVDGELEESLRSVAVPVRGADGVVVAALNISAGAGRTPIGKFRKTYVPALREAATEIEANLSKWQK